MRNTSIGFHTFSFFQKLSEGDYSSLEGDFIQQVRDGNMKRLPIEDKKNRKSIIGWEYTYTANKGIRWIMKPTIVDTHLTMFGITTIITPKVLLNKNYIDAATEEDIKRVEDLYNQEAKRISPEILEFGRCPVNRADCCLNLDIKELNLPCSTKQMMELIRRGDIPNHFVEWTKYDKTSHRKKAAGNNLYLASGSVRINYYWKYDELQDNFPSCPNINDSKHIIRLEVQCLYPKLYSLSKDLRHESRFNMQFDELTWDELHQLMTENVHDPAIPVDVVLADKITSSIIEKYFYRVVRKGDYFTLSGARWMVERYGFKREKEKRLLHTLELVKKCRGIAKAKATLSGEKLKVFKRSIKDLEAISVNPVTIPRRWGIKHIPNLMRAYHESLFEEQILFDNEYRTHVYLTEYLAEED